MIRTVLGALAICSTFTGAAHAQEIPVPPSAPAVTPVPAGIPAMGFGNPGQVAIAGDFAIGFVHDSHGTGVSVLTLAPALDYFIAPHVSVGGKIFFEYTKFDGGSSSNFGIGPRVGYDVPLGDMFSVYPVAGFGFSHASVSGSTGGSASANYLSLFLFVPFLFHPVPHFFIGLGPSIEGEVAGGNSSSRGSRIGLLSSVGGWFDY